MTVLGYVESAVLVASALVVTRVVAAASGQPRAVVRASTSSPHVTAHIAEGGYLVLAGRPDLAVPDLATTPRELSARLEFADAPALDLAFTLPASTTLPFRPPALEVELAPVSLVGTVRTAAFPYAAVAGAELAAGQVTPTQVFAGLRIPLASAHPAGAVVRERAIAAAAATTALSEAVDSGAQTVVVDDTTGFAGAGAVLALGDPVGVEHAVVDAVDLPARRLTLGAPLRRSRPAGAIARAHTLGGAGVATTLARAATIGDGVVGLAAALAPGVVELAGPVTELRATGAVSDAGGRWRIDGVRAVGRLTLDATAPGFLPATLVHDVDYRRPNLIDLDLTT